jgi:hypothetical protein
MKLAITAIPAGRLATALLTAAALALTLGMPTAAAAPPSPEITMVQELNPNEVVVRYWDASTNETAFELAEFDYFGNNRQKLRRIIPLPAQAGTGARAYVVGGLTSGTAYCYSIRAVLPPLPAPSFVNTTAWSDDKCATTYGTPPAPAIAVSRAALDPVCYVCLRVLRP